MESRGPLLLLLYVQRRCDQYHYHPTKPLTHDNDRVSLSLDHPYICPPKIQWPLLILLPPYPISSVEPSPLFILPIRWPILPLIQLFHSPMKSTCLDHSIFPKDEGDQLTNTNRSHFQQPYLTNNMGKDEKDRARPCSFIYQLWNFTDTSSPTT